MAMLGQYGLSEVRFLYVTVQAREPQPEDGAADVTASTTLSWRAGREAVSHEVYLSTDPNALELVDTTSTTTGDAGALDLATTYYWRVDEVNAAEAISTWEGADLELLDGTLHCRRRLRELHGRRRQPHL